MKLVKMSLVAALLVGANAFAVENVQVSGNAQLMYNTTDAAGMTSNAIVGNTGSGTLFDKDSSAADAGLNLNISADLVKNDLVAVSAGVGYTVLSTLGLENNFVSNVWGGAHAAKTATGANYGNVLGGAKVENANWFNEAWVAATTGKTTVKIGRMDLDTPLAFTETWSIEKNTFEAAVAINQDLPDTTIVAAFVGNGNGTETFGQDLRSNVTTLALANGAVVNANGDFATFGTNGAYAFGVVNNSFKPLTVQAWYYDVSKLATAYWLQADLACEKIPGLMAGAQYASVDVTGTTDASTTLAGMVGYEMKDMFTAKLAYSQVSSKGTIGVANTATSSGASKLYTEAWWAYGQVTALGAKAINLTVEAPVQDIVDLGLYVTSVDQKAANSDLVEITLTASKSFGPLDATLAYVNDKVDGSDAVNYVQAYLALNF